MNDNYQRFSGLLFCLGGSMVLGWWIAQGSVVPIVPLTIGLSVAVLLAIVTLQTGSALTTIIFLAFVMRLGSAWMQSRFVLFTYGWDEITYHSMAMRYLHDPAANLLADILSPNHYDLFVYSALTAGFYWLIEEAPFLMRVVNSALGSLVALCYYHIALRAGGVHRSALIAALLVAIMPSYVLFSGLHMRDALVWLTTSLMLWSFCEWLTIGDSRKLAFAVVWMLVTASLRAATFPLHAVVMLPFVFHVMYQRWRKDFLARVLVLWMLPALVIGSLVWLYLQGALPGERVLSLDYFRVEMAWRATSGSSGYLTTMVYSSWFDVIAALPLRTLHFAFGPFPWDVTNVAQAVTSFEGMVLFFATIGATTRLFRPTGTVNRRVVCFLVLFTVVGLFANAAIDSNYGTAVRHRMVYTAVLLLGASLPSLPRLRKSRLTYPKPREG